MPISRRRKVFKRKKGPTPKSSGLKLNEMNKLLDILDEAEQEYYAKQNNNEENKDGSE